MEITLFHIKYIYFHLLLFRMKQRYTFISHWRNQHHNKVKEEMKKNPRCINKINAYNLCKHQLEHNSLFPHGNHEEWKNSQ